MLMIWVVNMIVHFVCATLGFSKEDQDFLRSRGWTTRSPDDDEDNNVSDFKVC